MQYGDVNFHSIRNYSPEMKFDRFLTEACEGEFPTFLKTHSPYINEFGKYPAVVLYRDPVKVLASYKNYLEVERGQKRITHDEFLRHWKYGVSAWCKFHKYWFSGSESARVLFVDYQDAISDTYETLIRIYSFLGCEVEPEILNEAIKLSSRESMAKSLKDQGDPCAGSLEYNFVRLDVNVDRDAFNEEQIEYIRKHCKLVHDMLIEKTR